MAAPIIGRQRYVGYAKETTRNVAASAPTRWIPVNKFSPNPDYKYFSDKSGFGSRNAMNKKYLAQEMFMANLEVVLNVDYIGEMLFHLFGQVVSVQDGVTGAFEHTFTNLESTELPTFTIFYTGEGGQNYYATGCSVTKVDIEVPVGEGAPVAKFEVMGIKEVVDVTARTPAYTTSERMMMGRHLDILYADTVALLGTVITATGTDPAIAPVKRPGRDFNLSINNNSEVDQSYNAGAVYDILGKEVDYSATFSEIVRDFNAKTWQNAQDRKAWRFRQVNQAAGLIGTSATHFPTLMWTFGESLAEIKKPDIGLSDLVMLEYTIDAEKDVIAGFYCQLKMRNSRSAY